MTDLKEIVLEAMRNPNRRMTADFDSSKDQEEEVEAILDALRKCGALIEWRENTPVEAEKLSRELDSTSPVFIAYVKGGKLRDCGEMSPLDAHAYSPFGTSHFAIINPPKENPNADK